MSCDNILAQFHIHSYTVCSVLQSSGEVEYISLGVVNNYHLLKQSPHSHHTVQTAEPGTVVPKWLSQWRRDSRPAFLQGWRKISLSYCQLNKPMLAIMKWCHTEKTFDIYFLFNLRDPVVTKKLPHFPLWSLSEMKSFFKQRCERAM